MGAKEFVLKISADQDGYMTHDELVEKMCEADYQSQSYGSKWNNFCDKARWRKGMSAALRVAVEELFANPSDEELANTHQHDKAEWTRAFMQSRRSHYLKPKSAEQEVAERIVKALRCVDLTNESYIAAAIQDITGLIQQLKEQSK